MTKCSTSADGRQKRHLVAVADPAVHPRVVGVDRARDRAFVARELRELALELPPDVSNRCACRDVARQLRGAGDIAKPREQPHGHAHETRSASARALASSGLAVAPSIQTSPPSKYSRFHTGAICLTRSI